MNSLEKRTHGTPLTTVFYTELVFISIGLVLALYGLLLPRVSLLLWLPSLLLLCSSCASLSALIYLNKGVALRSRDNLLFYMLLTMVLVVFRVFCASLLVIGLFAPHSKPVVSCVMSSFASLHALFGLLAIAKTSVLRTGLDKRINSKDARLHCPQIEEIAVVNLGTSRLLASQTTLVTNLDEGDLVNYST